MDHCPKDTNLDGEANKLQLSIVLNLLIALMQIIGGMASGGLSLVADGVHNISDVISLVISYIAQILTKRSYTPRQTFGFKRAEILAGMINASLLIGISVVICSVAITRLTEPVEVQSAWVIALAGLGMVVNGLCAGLLKPHSHYNLNLRSAYLHLVADFLTSLSVLIAGIGIYIFNWVLLDSVLSLAISGYLLYSAWQLLLQALRVLMQFSPREISLELVGATICQHPEIANIHHVHCWKLSDSEIHFEAHLDFRTDMLLSEVSSVIEAITRELKEHHKISHAILQAEIGRGDAKDMIAARC